MIGQLMDVSSASMKYVNNDNCGKEFNAPSSASSSSAPLSSVRPRSLAVSPALGKLIAHGLRLTALRCTTRGACVSCFGSRAASARLASIERGKKATRSRFRWKLKEWCIGQLCIIPMPNSQIAPHCIHLVVVRSLHMLLHEVIAEYASTKVVPAARCVSELYVRIHGL